MGNAMKKHRMIKKYSNRRLYDTEISRYITLDEVKELVINNISFQIIDAKTNEDMTNHVLLQIISEQESHAMPIFTTEVLQNIIRFYGNSLQGVMSNYLEKSVGLFIEQQSDFKEKMKGLITQSSPVNLMSDLIKHNISVWQSMLLPADKKSKDKKSPKSRQTKP